MRKVHGKLVFSPSDLNRYLASPFASWMDRYHFEHPGELEPDETSADQALIAQTGDKHEATILEDYQEAEAGVTVIDRQNPAEARKATREALERKDAIIYQAALELEPFAGYADFLELNPESGRYEVWDTKLARAPKPYYAVQLCCYSEMLAAMTGDGLPDKFGVILGGGDRQDFRTEDFIHYYRRVKAGFLALQEGFTGKLKDRPEPVPRADHGRWASHADAFFTETDHLVQVAGISVGQIKKLKRAGITTMAGLAKAVRKTVPKMAADTLAKLVEQADLQCQTRDRRKKDPDSPPVFEVLPHIGPNGEAIGLAALPPDHPKDIFFDMEGYPLVSGGLEYLFGACTRELDPKTRKPSFHDWWAHDRAEEKEALEGFVDWAYARWKKNPGLHIYHYAAYEVSAVRRLSTRHDTRQDEVDDLLRNEVFVDLYQIVRQGLRVGGDSYSIKTVERLYRPKRTTEVANAVASIVQYAQWMESGEARTWKKSPILKGIRDYNEDDCFSTVELLTWLRKQAAKHHIPCLPKDPAQEDQPERVLPPDVQERIQLVEKLRKKKDENSQTLADLVDFHRREEKPIFWRMFDRAKATPEELRDDPACIEGVKAKGAPVVEKRSLIQTYTFDPSQECKLAGDKDSMVMFTHALGAKCTLVDLDLGKGVLRIKLGSKALEERLEGEFPSTGSLLLNELVPATAIQKALAEVAGEHLSGTLHPPVAALLERKAPAKQIQKSDESTTEAALRIARGMKGGCLVIQGPPGTGKTYTASHMIAGLIADGKKIGIASNSRKAVVNLIKACFETAAAGKSKLQGVIVGGEPEEELMAKHSGLRHAIQNGDGHSAYAGGVIGGTAWLFCRPEWEGQLDFLFIDEAGQVSMANAIAMSRCARNLVMLGDQMQLEQPVQGSHPGDAGLSALQYALKDLKESQPDRPVYHAVVPPDYGLFLGESRRMHPDVCRFISDSIYEGRLGAHVSCARQKVRVPEQKAGGITREHGIVFLGVEHDGNVQQSDEEVERVVQVCKSLLGRPYTDKEGKTHALKLEDLLFISPYNAQVRALKDALPKGAMVGSVDKFQGQEAAVCILSLCSSAGEYGSRGLAFILDRNRVNVAISRAKCLAVVVADPRIAESEAGSLDEMKLLNLFCKMAEY